MAVAGIGRALLKSVIKRSKNLQEKAINKPFSENYLQRAARYPDRNIQAGKRKTPKYKDSISPKAYDKLVKDFSKVYKAADYEGIGSLKEGMNTFGSNFFENIKKTAKKKNLLDKKDTTRVQNLWKSAQLTGIDFTDPRYFNAQNLANQKRAAVKDIYDEIIKKAPKDAITGKPILQGAKELYPVSIIPKLKKKYPDLFKDIENDIAGRRSIGKVLGPAKSGSREQVPYPDFQKVNTNIFEEAMYKQVPNFTDEAKLGKIPRQYLIDVFRSRPAEFVTGNPKKDANRYLRFLRDQEFFDPQSDYFYKKNPEFLDYSLMRQQPDAKKGLDLSHDVPTLMTTGSKKFPTQTQTMPFSGGEVGRTHYLPKNINRKLQPSLETQAINALKTGNYKKFVELDEQMMENNIRTTILDPDTGELYPMGGYAELGFNRGGKVDGLVAGGIANISRRLFLKGLGAVAGKAALPKTVTNLLPDVKEAVKMDSAPWINSMVNTVKKAADTGQSFSLGNGAKISYLKAPKNKYEPHQLSIKTVDGFEDRINFKESKNDIDIEFDIRDDFSNNQHIYVDKKTGTTELVDDNYYMTSPEDFAKDDPIIWDVNKKDIRKNMMLADETPNDYMYDYMSVPDDSDYSFMWERYVDSFSPYGNIFKTKQLADKEKAKKLLQEEMDEMRFEEQFRGGDMHGFNRGGIMKDVVPPLDEYAAGGVGRLILKQAPKVINKLREFAPQITGKPGKPADLKAVKSGDTYYTVFDEDGLAIKDFPNEKVARDFIRNNEFADMYTMGKSTDTPTAATQPDAPAMFFRSREEIIQGPPIMKGEEWLNFLQKRGIREGELSDTSLGPWLNANKGNKISKNDLVEKFDGMVPDFDVDVTGEAFKLSQNISGVLKKIDTSVYDPESAGVLRFLQTRMTDIVDEKSGAKALNDLDNVFEKAYGIKNVSQQGIPADNINVPYEVKQLMAEAMSGAGKRGVNLQGSAFVDRPAHAGSQTLSGGQNHREFIFRYNPKGPRKNEPIYNYAHSFGRAKTDNAFMHARISDRVDEYGNKLLFVEEFQSDMHQPISAAVREATKAGKAIPKAGKYAPRLDKEVAKLNKDNLEQMANIQRQIDRLLETKPDSPKLAKLYEQKEIIRNIERDKASKLSENTSNIPEGPFKNSQDYMEFAIKYLLRVAKDGNYDGVAFSTPAIKNRSIGPDNKDYKGNLVAYGDILKNAIRKAKSKSGADLFETTIGSGSSYGDAPKYYGVPALMIKGNTKALEKISKGLPAYNEGGLVQNVFNDVVPTL